MRQGDHLIPGCGVIGREVARTLAAQGLPVRCASRHMPPDLAGLPHQRLDALDGPALAAAARVASHLHLTLGLAYDHTIWQRDWPRVMAHAIAAARAQSSTLVFFDNLYAYGPPPLAAPLEEDHPTRPATRKGRVRAALQQMLQAAGEGDGLRWLIGRSADFYGPGVTQSLIYPLAIERQLRGRSAWVLGEPDARHSVTRVGDAARGLVRLVLDEGALGRVWHLPTPAQAWTWRELLMHSARLCGAPTVVHAWPRVAWWLAAQAVPVLAELWELRHQMTQDCVFGSARFAARYPDFRVTPHEEGLAQRVAAP